MRANKYEFAKQSLLEELGDKYPKSRAELSAKFLYKFGAFLDSPVEEDYEDYLAYEDAKYSSEMWKFFCKISEALAEKMDGEEAFIKAWDNCIDWVVKYYFPEFDIVV